MEGLRSPYESPTITETEVSEEEKKKERERILEKLDQALEVIKRIPEKERSSRQQWIISSVEEARTKIGPDGRFEVRAGEFSQREGIPVDALINEIGEADLKDSLHQSSKGYFELRPEMTGDKQHQRTEYEAKLVSSDHRATGSMAGDYALGMEEMSKRRELVLPDLKESETPKPPESPKPKEPEKLEFKKARIVDLSEVVKAMAWREAEQKMRNVLDDKRKSNFIKRAWVRLGEKGYLMKFYKEALDEMKNNRNLLAEIETRILKRSKGEIKAGTKDTSYEILDSLLDEYDKELTDADEKGEVVIDAGVNQAAGELFADFVAGRITSREDFDKEVEARIVPLLKGRKFTSAAGRDKEAVGLMYANNFWELAKGFKDYVDKKVAEFGPEHRGEILEHIKGEMALDLELGLKQRDLFETKPRETLKWYEKFVDKTQSIPILNKIVANPMAYGLIGGVAGTFVGRGITRAGAVAGLKAGAGLVGMAGAAPWLAPILAGMGFGGLYAAARRSRDLSYDRGMDLRRATLGAEIGGKRTEKMREFQYDHKKAEELIDGLKVLSAKGELAPEDKDAIAEIMARLKVEKEQSVDLVGVETEAGSKYKTKAIGMKDLKWELKQVQEKFGVTDEELQPLIDAWSAKFLDNIKAEDKAFDKYRHKEMAKAGVIGALMGLGAGALAQHVTYMIKGGETESALSHLWHVVRGDTQDFPQALHEVPIIIPGTHDQIPIKIPEGTILRQLGDHFELVDKDGDKVMDVFVNQDGSLAEKTLAEAADRGFQVQDHVETVARTISPLDHFKDQLGEHARVDWHDELGPRYSSFFNKLIEFEGKQQMLYLERGADGNVFVNAEGIAKNLIKNVEGAFKEFGTNPDGSVDSKLAHLRDQMLQWDKEGTLAKHLQLAIIPTEEANQQGTSILVDGSDNNFHLPLPKEFSDLCNTDESLKYLHHPFRFGEIRIAGHVLATTIGGDTPPIESSVPLHHPELIPPVAHDWEPPPVLPFYPRKPLEAAGGPIPVPIYEEPYEEPYEEAYEEPIVYEEKIGYEDPILYEETEKIPEMEKGSEKKELTPEEIKENIAFQERYVSGWDSRHRSTIESLNQQINTPMSEKCRLSIVLPAYREGETIYRALEHYTVTQEDDSGESFDSDLSEVIVLINRPNEKVAFDKKTIEEVERFKKEHPEYKVHLARHTFNFKEKPKMGLIYKTGADLTLFRNLQRKDEFQKSRHIMRTGGADAREKNPLFLKKVIGLFDRDLRLDQLRTESRQPKEALEKLPLFHFLATLDSGLNRLFTRGKSDVGLGSYSARLYAEVGGFNPNDSVKEEVNLSAKMRRVIEKSGDSKRGRHILVKNSIDDPRRALLSLYKGRGMVSRYAHFGEPKLEQELRAFKWEKEIKKVPPHLEFTSKNLSRELTSYFQFYLKRCLEYSKPIKKLREQGRSENELKEESFIRTKKLFNRMFSLMGLGHENAEYAFHFYGNVRGARLAVKDLSAVTNLMKKRKFNYWESH